MNKKLFSIKNFVAIITGSGRGIGLEIAISFFKCGAKVIRIDSNLQKNKKYKFEDFEIDLTKKKLLEQTINKIEKKHRRIDVLINNAGVTLSGNNPYDEKILKDTLSVNLVVAYNLSNQVCKIMSKRKKGSIINITSLAAETGFENNPSYQVSKAGLKQLSKALACDWGHKNIRINNICSGYIKTSMTKKSYKNPLLKKNRDTRMILNRWGEPKDIVGPCVFLASDSSSYITGSDIIVDGGWLAKGL
jgi:2-deoxy-D-gluconate 3-dehydrogenase|tara:strand:- start:45 stop:785 length:741 start_codon:yes stop_codon:yes gene_type:complete